MPIPRYVQREGFSYMARPVSDRPYLCLNSDIIHDIPEQAEGTLYKKKFMRLRLSIEFTTRPIYFRNLTILLWTVIVIISLYSASKRLVRGPPELTKENQD